jgi:CBS domain containing-hemolysin-like protein
VSLHRAVDENGDVDALTEDEVTIIGAVLDLRAKPVSKIMTPIADCFVLSIDAVLDEKVMDMVRNSTELFLCIIWEKTDQMLCFEIRLFPLDILVSLFIHLAAKLTLLVCFLSSN